MCFKIVAFVISLLVLFTTAALAEKTPYDWAFLHLDYVCQAKVKQLKRLTDYIHQTASSAAEDETVISFFEVNRHFYLALREGNVPAAVRAEIDEVRKHFDRYYIENFIAFYDFLFVDMDGTIFYTLRKESDYQLNLMEEEVSGTPLGVNISKKPSSEVFIDFHEYGPSAEPAAFFVEPVHKNGGQIGWVVVQLSINKLNSIFASTDDLGQTGETFLVNKDGLMLTESYFKSRSTILKERLDDRNIKAKFGDRRGHRAITDYRGAQALSSFEVIEFMGTTWLIVAKVDKDEIITNHYLQHKRYYANKLLDHLTLGSFSSVQPAESANRPAALRVDMDEFMKADNGQILETWGISTCTGLLATIPKRFAYLAHISPKDRVYGGYDTSLVDQIFKRMQSFDIYPSEKHNVVFVIVAPHLDSLINIIDRTLNEGYLLSQIKVLYNHQAESAALVFGYKIGELTVTWKMKHKSDQHSVNHLGDSIDLGRIVEKIMAVAPGTLE